MKSPSANFLAELAKNTGAQWRNVVEIAADSGTLYLSDQGFSIGGQAYTALVHDFGKLNLSDDIKRPSTMRLKLANVASLLDTIRPGLDITYKVWFANLGAGDPETMFVGTISDDIKGDAYSITFTCRGKDGFYDKSIGDPITAVNYPNADPDFYNRIEPIVFGSIKNHECLPIVAGGVSTLRADLSAGAGTIELSDASRFPNSGTVAIGAEEDITYSGKSGNDLTGAAGISQDYVFGELVMEVGNIKYMVAGHICKAITNPRILPYGFPVSQAVLLTSGFSTNLNDGGITTITLTDLPLIRREVALAINPENHNHPVNPASHDHTIADEQDYNFNDPDHGHTQSGQSSVLRYGTSASGWTNSANCIDGNENTDADYVTSGGSETSNTLSVDFSTSNLGTLQDAYLHIKLSAGGFEADWIRVKADLNFPASEQVIEPDPSGTPEWFRLYFTDINEWNELDNVRVQFRSPAAGSSSVHVWEVYWEVQYTADISTDSTDITSTLTGATSLDTESLSLTLTSLGIGGNSVADTLGGILIIDIDGYKDTPAGHWTGSANALIKEPWDLIHFTLETFSNGPVAHANIDLAGSFADAESNLTANYEWGFAINQQLSLNELLSRLGIQTWSRIIFEAGIYKLNRIKDATDSINRVLDTDDDSILIRDRLAVNFIYPNLKDIVNSVELRYNIDYALSMGRWNNPDAYEGVTIDTDAPSISNFGTRHETTLMFAIRDNSTMADDLRDKLLEYSASNRLGLSFPAKHKHMDLERGDIVKVASPQVLAEAKLFEILGMRHDIPAGSKGYKGWLNLVDLLKRFIELADSAFAGDVLTVINRAFPLPDSAFMSDVVAIIDKLYGDAAFAGDAAKIDIDAVLSDSAVMTDILTAINRAFPLPESAFIGDTLTKLDKIFGFADSAFADDAITSLLVNLFFDSAFAGDAANKFAFSSVAAERGYQDLFAEGSNTELSLHVPDIGVGWTKLIEVGGTVDLDVEASTDSLKGDAGSNQGALYQTDDIMSIADYEVSVELAAQPVSAAFDRFVLAARIQDSNNMYAVHFNKADGRLAKKIAGVWTILGASFPLAGVGDIVTLKVDGTTISALVNGVEGESVTDNALAGAGKAGIGMGAVILSLHDIDAGMRLDDFGVKTTPAFSDIAFAGDGIAIDIDAVLAESAIASDVLTSIVVT